MTRFTGEEALQMLLDSEEEFTVSSDEEQDSDDERLYFEERLDPAEDIISEENAASLSSSAGICRNATDIHTGNVASSSFTRTGASRNEPEIHKVNVAASLSPSFDTRIGRAHRSAIENKKGNVSATPTSSGTRTRARSCATGNNKENMAATLSLSFPRTRSHSNATDIHPMNVAASLSLLPGTHKRHRSASVLKATETNVSNTDSDKAPVAKRVKTNIQASSSRSVLSWKTETDIDVVPHTLRFFPAREPGPQLSPADAHTPLSLFKMFFPEDAVSTLCHNTNAQAARAKAKGSKYKWKDVSVTEMYRYIGLLFYMAMVKLISIRDYWRQDNVFSVPFPATVMSRERYRTISWNVHMSHPEDDKVNDRKRGTAEHDRLFRVKPLMDTIRQACINLYHPKRNLAVDERMVACKANTGMTQYMKAKPTKWGFKLFVLADSSNGYTVDFSVYTGKNNFPTGHGLSYDAVTSLLDCKTLGSGYHVYMDNFYTSPKLLTDMFAMKFGACGTYRDFRKECPRDATNAWSYCYCNSCLLLDSLVSFEELTDAVKPKEHLQFDGLSVNFYKVKRS
nr:piggyBac transposable element-derived protein 4-like [Misgurnus anguillicaudatus]